MERVFGSAQLLNRRQKLRQQLAIITARFQQLSAPCLLVTSLLLQNLRCKVGHVSVGSQFLAVLALVPYAASILNPLWRCLQVFNWQVMWPAKKSKHGKPVKKSRKDNFTLCALITICPCGEAAELTNAFSSWLRHPTPPAAARLKQALAAVNSVPKFQTIKL